MSPWELLAVAIAGTGAGFINSVAGSGSLITFPTLLALGVPPVTANVSNNIGLVPGGVAGAIAWRHELRGHARRVLLLAIPLIGWAIAVQNPQGGTVLLTRAGSDGERDKAFAMARSFSQRLPLALEELPRDALLQGVQA